MGTNFSFFVKVLKKKYFWPKSLLVHTGWAPRTTLFFRNYRILLFLGFLGFFGIFSVLGSFQDFQGFLRCFGDTKKVDIILPEFHQTILLRPLNSGSFYFNEIGNRLLKSAAKTRPTLILHSLESKESFEKITAHAYIQGAL